MALVTQRQMMQAIRDAQRPEHPRRLDFSGGESTMSYSDWSFGFEISGATVTVNAGKVRHGTRTAVSVAETPVEIAEDDTWIYVEYTYGAGAIITSSTTEPTDTEEVHKRVLYLVTLEDGIASVGKGNIRHLGDIVIPGAFG